MTIPAAFHSNPSIDTVIFDFGKVLIDWNPRNALLSLSESEKDDFFNAFDFHNFFLKQDAGRSLEEGLAVVRAEQQKFAFIIEKYYQNYDIALGKAISGMKDLILDLKNNDFKIYGLTNWCQEMWHFAEERIPCFELFDGIVTSWESKLAKPDVKIYELLLNRYNLDATSCVFVDDREENVKIAENLGFNGIVFQNSEQLRRELHDLGVLYYSSPNLLY